MSPRPGSWSPRTAALVGVALVAAATRVLPHPPSFTPVGALALFGGSHFASRRRALAVPLLAMVVSDLALTARYGTAAFTLLPWVYGAFGITVCLGRWLRPPNRSAPRVAIASLVAALLFFLVANFGVWVQAGRYPPTPEGLLACYVAALPYLRTMVLGNLAYAVLLFGGFALWTRRVPALAEPPPLEHPS